MVSWSIWLQFFNIFVPNMWNPPFGDFARYDISEKTNGFLQKGGFHQKQKKYKLKESNFIFFLFLGKSAFLQKTIGFFTYIVPCEIAWGRISHIWDKNVKKLQSNRSGHHVKSAFHFFESHICTKCLYSSIWCIYEIYMIISLYNLINIHIWMLYNLFMTLPIWAAS